MTDRDWLTSSDPLQMLAFLHSAGKAGERKLRLFACAWMRRLWQGVDKDSDLQGGRRLLRVLDVVEAYADGKTDATVLAQARRQAGEMASHAETSGDLGAGGRFLCNSLGNFATAVAVVAGDSAWVAVRAAARASAFAPSRSASDYRTVEAICREAWTQCGLLRDIVGNPFEPACLDPSWRTWNGGTVVRLAQAACQERQPGGALDDVRLAILADALEEAGCTNAEILAHLRGWECCRYCGGVGEADEMFLDVGPYWVTCSSCQGAGRMRLPAGHAPGCSILDGLLGKG